MPQLLPQELEKSTTTHRALLNDKRGWFCITNSVDSHAPSQEVLRLFREASKMLSSHLHSAVNHLLCKDVCSSPFCFPFFEHSSSHLPSPRLQRPAQQFSCTLLEVRNSQVRRMLN